MKRSAFIVSKHRMKKACEFRNAIKPAVLARWVDSSRCAGTMGFSKT